VKFLYGVSREQNPVPAHPLERQGSDLDSLYRYEGPDIEETYGKWLRTTIASLEKERHAPLDSGRQSPLSSIVTAIAALFLSLT
jgi:hypothetical protein